MVSTGRVSEKDSETQFLRHDVVLELETTGKWIGKWSRSRESGIYTFQYHQRSKPDSRVCGTATNWHETNFWHSLLAHTNFKDLTRLSKVANGIPEIPLLKRYADLAHFRNFITLSFLETLKGQNLSMRPFFLTFYGSSDYHIQTGAATYLGSLMAT